MRLLHGRPLAERLAARSRERSDALRGRDIHPEVAAISVGIDPAANTYLQRLARGGRALGIAVRDVSLSRDASEQSVMAELDRASRDRSLHGVLLLTPLPGKLDEGHLVDHIAPEKDIEGVNPYNVGLLLDGRPRFVPSTAEAIIELLRFHQVALAGVDVVIVGRSTVVGRPAAALLLNEDATVTIAHKRTTDIGAVTRRGAVVVVAVGRAGFLTGDMIAPGAIVVDAGINMTPAGIAGDVDADSVASVAGALSPVPGGVGTVTTALLLRNVLTAAETQTAGG
ncbi:MAG TPA: bifunctional 5,10-methylenetetrahydrofolate dehydrogenase/5,10-methenyltetrahydrofolate cyclohydrolase [Candidatus Limnocylindria bacterium]|jgi:methylenetetrahydrofolate dehydrogenase (NADP+)/methenyltetrahydrofolate cyclohydrolase|nr:bifunctional 5,10-methylenetetrahydrofolate dehydrogenase/5,10-methenyltetrahydrofolate cyclohydrolase [Candidatus Limnocylindria bacterium]